MTASLLEAGACRSAWACWPHADVCLICCACRCLLCFAVLLLGNVWPALDMIVDDNAGLQGAWRSSESLQHDLAWVHHFLYMTGMCKNVSGRGRYR